MNDPRRRVTIFMIAGVVAAVIAGIAVWKMSLPTPPDEAGYQADAASSAASPFPTGASNNSSDAAATSTPEQDTGTEWAGEDIDTVRPGKAGTGGEAEETPARDPLLPPNAVVNSNPRTVAPTNVYRPSNVLPTTLPRKAQGSSAEAEPTTGPGEPVPTSNQAPGGTPTEPQTPATPTETDSGTPSNTAPSSPGSTAPTSPSPQETAPGGPAQSSDQQAIIPQNTLPAPSELLPQQPTQQGPAQNQPAPVQQYTPGSETQNWWSRVRGYFGM